MSKNKDIPKATDTAPSVDRQEKQEEKKKPSGLFQKLKSVFSKGPAEVSPPPARKKTAPTKKGSTSFMQSFKVREVGREREEPGSVPPSGKSQPEWADEMDQPSPTKEIKVQRSTGRLTGSVSATSTILRPDEEGESATPEEAKNLTPPQPPTAPAAKPTEEAKPESATGPIVPKSYIIKPDTDKLKTSQRLLSETSKKPPTGKLVPHSTVLIPDEDGDGESATPEDAKNLTPPQPPTASAAKPTEKAKPESLTGPIVPKSYIVKPDTGKIPPDPIPAMPPGKQTHKITAPSVASLQEPTASAKKEPVPSAKKLSKPPTGPVKPQSILLSPDTDKLKKAEITKKSTLNLTKKQTSAIPAPQIEKVSKEEKAEKAEKELKVEKAEKAEKFAKPPTGRVKPQSILLSPDTDEIKPPAESGKKTQRNLKKETIRGLIPLPTLPSDSKPRGLLTKPKPPQTVPTPPEKSRDTSVLAKGSLTGKIKLEGMAPPPPPPVISKPATQPMKPTIEAGKGVAKSLTGRIDPQSIIIRPDTDKLSSTRKESASESTAETRKPKTGPIQPQSTVLEPEEADRHERTPVMPTVTGKVEAKAVSQEAPTSKPSTGPVRPQSIVISPDTGEIKDVPKEAAITDTLRTRIEIAGIEPPPPPAPTVPQPKPMEPALKDIPKRKPDTGPVTPQSIVIRPDTTALRLRKPEEVPSDTIESELTKPPAAPVPLPSALKDKEKDTAKPMATKPAPVVAAKLPAKPKPAPQVKPVTQAKPKPAQQARVKPKAQAQPKPKPQATPKPSAVAAALSQRAAERKKQPKAVVAEPSGRRRRSLAWKGGLIALLLLLLGLGIYFLRGYQDTQLIVQIQEGDRVVDPQVHIVLNIAGKLEIIRQEYQRRLRPIEAEIAELQQYMSSAKADLAGKTERLNLLQEQLDKNRNDIPKFLQESKNKLDDLWSGPGAALDRAYADKKQALLDAIAERAGLLQIPYVKNPEMEAIPVAVNAYRLALYGQAGGIDTSGERRWAESILRDWDSYQEEWRQAQLDLKKTALKIKKEPSGKIGSAEQQVDLLLREMSAVQMDLRMLSTEVTRYEELLADAKLRRVQAVPPFLEEIGRIPGDFEVAQFPLQADGNLTARNLQESEQLQEGNYYVLVQARKGDELSWAVKAVTIIPNEINSILIESGDFRSFDQILEGNADILLTLTGSPDSP